MNWKKVSIKSNEQTGDIISSVLIDAGALGTEVIGGTVPEAKGDEYAEPKEQSGDVTIVAYYGETDFDNTLRRIKADLIELEKNNENETGSLQLSVDDVEDTDWNANFRKHFTTFRAAGNIVIKPTWENYEAKPEDLVIEMDPGMAFGSGVHETTKMCLELVQKYMPKTDNWSVLDVGCGSGILGIACAKMGAGKVTALDYDNVSVEVTRDNAERNNVNLEARQSDLLSNAAPFKYDIVLANIIADIIIRLNENIKDFMTQDAVYIISGIIDDRLSDVIESLNRNGFKVIETLAMADWRALAVRK